jgi:hypothetical protein
MDAIDDGYGCHMASTGARMDAMTTATITPPARRRRISVTVTPTIEAILDRLGRRGEPEAATIARLLEERSARDPERGSLMLFPGPPGGITSAEVKDLLYELDVQDYLESVRHG